jgi:Zn-dependent protease
MVLFHFGWANPVPINTRHFKNPRRDMALSALAGPVSNILMAFVFGALLRLMLLVTTSFFEQDLLLVAMGSLDVSMGFIVVAIITIMMYLGIVINFGYAIFNLIPIPPLDGSRIFYVFLPTKWYFGIMRYERYIMIGMLLLLWLGLLTAPLSWIVGNLEDLVLSIYGISYGKDAYGAFYLINHYISSLI